MSKGQERFRNPLSKVEDEIALDIAIVYGGLDTSAEDKERIYKAAQRVVVARRDEINDLLSSLYEDLEFRLDSSKRPKHIL